MATDQISSELLSDDPGSGGYHGPAFRGSDPSGSDVVAELCSSQGRQPEPRIPSLRRRLFGPDVKRLLFVPVQQRSRLC